MRRRLGAFLGPDQRGTFAGQRQNRKRACGQKMFFGAAVVIALVADGDDDTGLIVVPAMGGNSRRARAISIARRRRPTKRLASITLPSASVTSTPPPCESNVVTAVALRSIALGLGALEQRIDQMTVLDHVRERLARLDIAGEGQEHRTGRVLQLGIGDDHVENRLRRSCDLIPDAERIEQPAAGGDDRGRPGIAAWP